jgi:hypothetical protein
MIEEVKVVALHARAVEVHERIREGAQIGGQGGQERLGVEDELVDIAHARREGQPDAAVEIRADGALAEVEAPGPLGVEAHVVEGRAPASHVGQDELPAIADHARIGMGLSQDGPVANLGHGVARDAHRPVGERPRVRRTGEHVLAAQQ